MKKITSILLSLLLIFASSAILSGCNDDDKTPTPVGTVAQTTTTQATTTEPVTEPVVTGPYGENSADANPKLIEYIEDNMDTFLPQLESGFTSGSGMTCKSSARVDGNDIVISISIDQLVNVTESMKDSLKAQSGNFEDAFDAVFNMLKVQVPEIEHLIIELCDVNGEVIIEIVADGVTDGSSDNPSGGDGFSSFSSISEYIEENKESLIAAFESSFSQSSGMSCKSDITVKGNGFIIEIRIQELSNVDDDTKELLQETYDSMSGTFDTLLESLQAMVPDLEYFRMDVCDKYGDLLATILIGEE